MTSRGAWNASQDLSTAMINSSPEGAGVVHLVTILYESAESLPSFLDDLQAQDLQDWRLHVIDNASPDNSLQVVEERADPRISVIKTRRTLGLQRQPIKDCGRPWLPVESFLS